MSHEFEIELLVPVSNLPGWTFWAEYCALYLRHAGYTVTVTETTDVNTGHWLLLTTHGQAPRLNAETRMVILFLQGAAQMIEQRNFQKQLAAMALNNAQS